MAGAQGRFFEDFRLGEEIRHATPRTVSEADQALTIALTGSRFALHSADSFAQGLGLCRARRSMTGSPSTSCSARRCRTSR